MPIAPAKIFDRKEQKAAFFRWLQTHADAFVLNFPSSGRNASNNLVFHRARCKTLLTRSFPTPTYHKVCDPSLGSLIQWAEDNRAFKNPPSAHACGECFKGGESEFDEAKVAENWIPEAVDHSPPEKVEVTILRIIRDTELAKRIKGLHEGKCQLCNEQIALPTGGYYAEAHHLKPLGSPHQGPDVESNIVCLCPNCHATLDYGVREIAVENFRRVDGHHIDVTFVEYHNEKVFRGVRGRG